jgi:hypothetical protein
MKPTTFCKIFLILELCFFMFIKPVFAEDKIPLDNTKNPERGNPPVTEVAVTPGQETVLADSDAENQIQNKPVKDASADFEKEYPVRGKPITDGFSGMFELGLYSDIVQEDSNKTATSPGMMLNLRYGDREAGRDFSVSSNLQNADANIKLEFRQNLFEYGSLKLGILNSNLSETKADSYADYYNEDTDSTFTDEKSTEYMLDYQQIYGTPLSFGFRYKSIQIENDEDVNYSEDLARDGVIQTLSAGYGIELDETMTLTPGFSYINANMDGASNSYDGYRLGLKQNFKIDQDMIMMNISGGYNDYKKINPIFSKEQFDKMITMEASYRIHEIFDWQDISSRFLVKGETIDSNINYFDRSDAIIGVSIGLNF